MKPQISIATFFNYDIPIYEQIPMISKAGFTHISLGGTLSHYNYLDIEERKKLKDVLKKHSLKIDTVHGCTADLENAVEKLIGAAEAAYDLGVDVVVFHLSQFFLRQEQVGEKVENALKVCEKLELVAQKYNIRFAVENVHPRSATDVLKQVLPKLNRKYFGLCYDSSHDQIDGPRPFNLLDKFGDRLFAVHLSDRIKEFVDHVVPGEGFIDFDGICDHLKKNKYNRPLLLEVWKEHTKFKDPTILLKETYNAGLKLSEKINE